MMNKQMANLIHPYDLYDGIVPSGNKEIPGWNSNSEVFMKLIDEIRPSIIFEVGTWLGASAINMAHHAKSISLDIKIYCVDTWLGAEEFWTTGKNDAERNLKIKNGYPQIYFDFLSNVIEHGMQDIIVPIPNTSHIGSIILSHYRLMADLIYIDGSHEYVDVKNDIQDYIPLLNPGGIMFGDDMITWKDVGKAVEDSLGKDIEIYQNNFWIFRKPK
jgi:predicted O-methyltransferase YrrM